MDRAAVVGRLRAAGCVWAEDEADLLLAAADDDADSPLEVLEVLEARVRRRVGGEPLEQVLGWASFCGLRIHVVLGVFVPRRRSEFLVRTAVHRSPARPVVLDLCAGTGALGAAFSSLTRVAELHVAELDPVALSCARRNIPPGTATYQGDLYAPLPADLHGRVDVLLANAPYVPADELHLLPPEARDHEPAHTLDGGADGLDLHRRIVADACRWLAPGGALFVEVSEAQRDTAEGLVTAAGLAADTVADDGSGATVVIGTRAPHGPKPDASSS